MKEKLQKLLEQAISDISGIHSDLSIDDADEKTTDTANQLWIKLEEIQKIIDNACYIGVAEKGEKKQ